MGSLQGELPEGSTIGHVKALLASHGAHLVANLVERGEPVIIRGRVKPGAAASLIVNARVELEPQVLELAVRGSLSHDAAMQTTITELRCFRPSRPVPTYRSVGAVS